MSVMCGGPSRENAADEEIQKLIETHTVKFEAEKKHGSPFEEYRAVSYKSQIVAGTNFFVKVFVGKDKYIHLRVFRPLPQVNSPPSLDGIQLNKSESDSIEYF